MKVEKTLCPSCGASRQPGESFCANCGPLKLGQAALGETFFQRPGDISPLGDADEAETSCPFCGKPVRKGGTFCGACGKSLVFVYQPLQPGQALNGGLYTVQKPLSKGGMGAIYLATDHKAFDRTVVIKAMLDYFDSNKPKEVEAAHERFFQEGKTLAELRHSAIPQIFTYFQDGPNNYIVMEYTEGHDLEQGLTHQDRATSRIIAGKPYPHEAVMRWGVTVCRVLEYLASRQPYAVVHHDIKPANLILDQNSGDVRLVDFGTAKARLFLQTSNGSVGMQKSSVYGTQGYAPLEQYNGQSEPSSDVYALAATLYHLATDDDPRNHPFSFPKLKQLGPLGPILTAALNDTGTERPTATEMRQKLETLLLPPNNRPIQTTDGTEIMDEHDLLVWGEQHWTEAAIWLYDKMPDQIEAFWGKNKLAQDVRIITQQHPNDQNAGLDALLGQLDPKGFALERPRLVNDKRILNFGILSADTQSTLPLVLHNSGRRYVKITEIKCPNWITTQNEIALIPGEEKTILVTVDMQQTKVGGKFREILRLRQKPNVYVEIGIWATSSRLYTLWNRYPNQIMITASIIFMLGLLLLIGLGGSSTQH